MWSKSFLLTNTLRKLQIINFNVKGKCLSKQENFITNLTTQNTFCILRTKKELPFLDLFFEVFCLYGIFFFVVRVQTRGSKSVSERTFSDLENKGVEILLVNLRLKGSPNFLILIYKKVVHTILVLIHGGVLNVQLRDWGSWGLTPT